MIVGFTILILGYQFRSFFGFRDISITLETTTEINRSKIIIYRGWYAHPVTLFPKNKGKLIFDGKTFLSFDTDYGENDYLIVYSDSFYTTFRHNKTTNRLEDTYSFKVSKLNNKIILDVDIKGTDPLNYSNLVFRKIDKKIIDKQTK